MSSSPLASSDLCEFDRSIEFSLFTRCSCLFLAVHASPLTVAKGIRGHLSRVRQPEPEELSRSDRDVVWKPWDQRYIVRACAEKARACDARHRRSPPRLFLLSRGRKAIALIARHSVLAAVLSDLQHPAVIEKCTRRRSPRTSRRSSPQRRYGQRSIQMFLQ